MPTRGISRSILLANSLLCAAMFCATAQAQALKDEITVVNAWFDDEASLRAITPLLGHAQIDRDKGVLRTEADGALRRALTAAGMRVETDIEGTLANRRLFHAEKVGMKSIPGYSCYRTVEETEATMQSLVTTAPDLAEIISIGPSWQASVGPGGYQLKVLRVTNRNIPGPKPKVFIMNSVHAREYTPAEFATRFVEEMIAGYGVDPDATWLIDHHEIHALLQANPDGRKRAEAGSMWRKNTNTNFCGSGSKPGIDLNRNFPFEWGNWNGSSTDPCNETFRGPSPQSEPETQAIVNYVRNTFDDNRDTPLTSAAPANTPGMFFDFHSHSGLVLWPWGFMSTDAPNALAYQALGRRLAWFNNYDPQQSVGLYATDGTTDDFAYGELGIAAITMELGTAFFQDCASFENTIYPSNRDVLRYSMRVARAPYLLPSGPDVYGLKAEPELAAIGDSVTFRATFDDVRQRQGSFNQAGPLPATQAIASAAAYIGVPPWQTGALPLAMQASDGNFDAGIERASVSIDTSLLPVGRQLVWVDGRDAAGNAGPPSAVFIDMRAQQDLLSVLGTVTEFGTQTPLAASVRAGIYTSATMPSTGDYVRRLPAGTYAIEYMAEGHESFVVPNVSGQAGQTFLHDVELYRLCARLEDPVELAVTTPFSAQAPWTRRTGAGQNGGAAWLQSASGNYANGLNTSLTSEVINLTGYTAPELAFDQRCDTEDNWDFGRVEISTNGGGVWNEVFRCDGETSWRRVRLALPQLANAASAQIRFRFTSDRDVERSGWALDNIALQAGGQACRDSQGEPRPPSFHDGFEAAIK